MNFVDSVGPWVCVGDDRFVVIYTYILTSIHLFRGGSCRLWGREMTRRRIVMAAMTSRR